jgi:adenine-specific DNA-methyltransferase
MTDMQDDNQDIQNVPSSSPNLKTELAKKLQELIPEAIADGKVDTQKLKELLADDAGDDTERFGLFWPGKKRAMRAAQEPTTATLKPAPDESKDWDITKNLLIEGDNLEVLKVLQRQYHNKIKMIYIDPPYNTGKDFVYPDNFKEGLANYLEFTKQVDEGGRKISTNSDTEGRYHSNWLNMMYPRLKLARNLLTDDGFIFISIDYHESENLKKICNEIYGEVNFRGEIIRATGTTTGQDANNIGSSYDFCLCYSRTSSSKLGGIPLTGKDLNRFNNDDGDGKGKYALLQLRKTGNADRKEDRENMFYPVFAPDNSEVYPIGPDNAYLSRWRVAGETYKKLVQDGLIIWNTIDEDTQDEDEDFDTELDEVENNDSVQAGISSTSVDIKNYITNWKPYVKYYLSGRTKQVSNLWSDIDGNKKGSIELKSLFNNKKIFDNPKPVGFIERLLQITCNDSDIILDFFAGSNTTAHAVYRYNAVENKNIKFITVQLPEPTFSISNNKQKPNKGAEIAFSLGYKNIADLSRDRAKFAGEEIAKDYSDNINKREIPLDVGYRTYKLADTNFIKWQNTYTTNVDQLQARLDLMRESSSDNASQLDLLTEIMLKLGLELTTDVHQMTLEDLPFYSVANGSLLLYLDEHITPTLDQLRTILEGEHKPVKFVILEDSFKGDDQLKTNLTQICKSNSIELWTV